MRIELPIKTKDRLINLINQRGMIENEINLICSTILEFEGIDTETFKLNKDCSQIIIKEDEN